MVLSHYLAGSSMNIDMCESGRHVLELMNKKSLKDEYPDLIILDHHMPYMDGFENVNLVLDQVIPEIRNNFV